MAAAVAIAALAAGAGTAEAAKTKIAFLDSAGSGEQIFTVRSDGTHRRQLTHMAGFLGHPDWSPNKKRLVFSRTNGAPSRLWTMRANGTHKHKIPRTKSAIEPDWSPNGKKIAYAVENSSGGFAIFTIGVNGRHRKRLTPFQINISPAWSPSGKSIVYSGNAGIIRMRANGTHKRTVVPQGEDPDWSPNGKRIAFVDEASNPDAVSDIYTVRPDGSGRRNLTDTRPGTTCSDPAECARISEWPAWSPNGKRVLFDEQSSGGGDEGLFTVHPDGSGIHHLTATGHSADW